MDERALFAAVLAERYGLAGAELSPLSSSPGAISHSFLVERPGKGRAVLHAYRDAWVEVVAPHETVAAHVAGLVALLDAFAAREYPAPRLVRARDGAATVTWGEWSLLLVGYVAGEPADYAPDSLRGLGAAVGRLHALPPPLPAIESWWSLGSAVPPALARLDAGAATVPPAWRDWHDTCRATLATALTWADLPQALIHADAWIGNTLRTAAGEFVLIDWECAGRGLAVLDLGSLLIHAHYDLPDHAPLPERIAAVLDGYLAHRQPTAAELAVLPQATQFGPAFRSALFYFRAQQRGWDEAIERHLTRERGRFGPCAALGEMARAWLERWASPQ